MESLDFCYRPVDSDVTAGVITTRSNRMKFRLPLAWKVIGSNPVGDSDFSLCHARDILIISPSQKNSNVLFAKAVAFLILTYCFFALIISRCRYRRGSDILKTPN